MKSQLVYNMKALSKIILSITGLIIMLPGYLIFIESDLLPPSSRFNSLLLIITESLAFTVAILVYINRKKLFKVPIKKMNTIIVGGTFLLLLSLFTYTYYMDKLVLEDDFGSIILPMYNTDSMADKINQYGNIINFFRETDSISLNEYFNEHEDIESSILWSKITLYGLFVSSISLLLFVSLLGAIRLNNNELES